MSTNTDKPFRQRSLREAARQGSAKVQQSQAVPAMDQLPPMPPVVATPPKPAKKPKLKKAVAGTEDVPRRCGHPVAVEWYSTDDEAMREKRRADVRRSVCPACKERRKVEQSGRSRLYGRLPNGSVFGPLVYDGEKQEWTGFLAVPDGHYGRLSFTATAGGVFRLLQLLDRQFRESPEGKAFAEAQQAKQTT